MTTILLLHGNEEARRLFEEATSARVVIVRRSDVSAYDALPAQVPRIADLAGVRPGERLLVFAFSAGAWALRRYLNNLMNRAVVSAAVFLDGMYGAAGGECDLSPYTGVISYGREANASPERQRLIMTYSAAHPAPAICSLAVARAVGSGPGVEVRGYQSSDHNAQLTGVGPVVARELAAPPRRSGSPLLPLVLFVTAAAIVWRVFSARSSV